MITLSSRSIIVIGFFLVLLGFLLPLLIVVKVLPSTYFLNFFSYLASVLGLCLGLVGAAQMALTRKRPRDDD
jgi:hypothetical protein